LVLFCKKVYFQKTKCKNNKNTRVKKGKEKIVQGLEVYKKEGNE